MVQEHSYGSYSSYVPDPQDSKSTYKTMVTDRYRTPQQQQQQQQQPAMTTTTGQAGGNKNKKSKTDVWGPIFQNRQHFVDMHIC